MGKFVSFLKIQGEVFDYQKNPVRRWHNSASKHKVEDLYIRKDTFHIDELDTVKKPLHVMEGVLENNKFPYTADEGLYEGGGTLSKDLFEGYYKGPVDGTYKMWRVNNI